MNNEFKVVIGIMRASNLLLDDLKKTLKNYPINATEFAVMVKVRRIFKKYAREYYLLSVVQPMLLIILRKKDMLIEKLVKEIKE